MQRNGKAGEDVELLGQPCKAQCFALRTTAKSPEGLFWGVERMVSNQGAALEMMGERAEWMWGKMGGKTKISGSLSWSYHKIAADFCNLENSCVKLQSLEGLAVPARPSLWTEQSSTAGSVWASSSVRQKGGRKIKLKLVTCLLTVFVAVLQWNWWRKTYNILYRSVYLSLAAMKEKLSKSLAECWNALQNNFRIGS